MLAIKAKNQPKKLDFDQAKKNLIFLAIRSFFANVKDLNQFIYFIQFNIKG